VCLCVWSGNPEKGGQRSILDCKRLWVNSHSTKVPTLGTHPLSSDGVFVLCGQLYFALVHMLQRCQHLLKSAECSVAAIDAVSARWIWWDVKRARWAECQMIYKEDVVAYLSVLSRFDRPTKNREAGSASLLQRDTSRKSAGRVQAEAPTEQLVLHAGAAGLLCCFRRETRHWVNWRFAAGGPGLGSWKISNVSYQVKTCRGDPHSLLWRGAKSGAGGWNLTPPVLWFWIMYCYFHALRYFLSSAAYEWVFV
jgi:hypothetical protein